MRRCAALVTLLSLGGCNSVQAPVTAMAECKLFSDPGFAVQGLRPKDSNAIAAWQEVGIRVCGWPRPAPDPIPVETPAPTTCEVPAAQVKYRTVEKPGETKYVVVGSCQVPVPDAIKTPTDPVEYPVEAVKAKYNALRSRLRQIFNGATDDKFR